MIDYVQRLNDILNNRVPAKVETEILSTGEIVSRINKLFDRCEREPENKLLQEYKAKAEWIMSIS